MSQGRKTTAPSSRWLATVRRVCCLLVAALVMSGLGVLVQPPQQAHAAAYATGGNGAYKDRILWLTWGGGVNGTRNVAMANGNTTTATTAIGSETMVSTCTIGGISGPLNSYAPGTWSGDYLDDMYNIGGSGGSNQLVNGLINVTRAATVNFTVTCTATIGGRTVDIPGMVVADAEQGTNTQEWVAATGSGNFSLIERGESCPQGVTSNNSLDVTQSGGNQTLRLIGGTPVGTCAGPTGIAYVGFNSAAYTGTNRAVSMGFTVRSSDGLQAVAIGLILQSDVGDAPSTYTRPAHTLASVANPTLGVRASTPLNSAPLAPLTLPALRLGSLLDADGPLAGNVGANADDLNNLDDEDGVTLPAAVDVGATTSVPVVVNGGSGFLNAWFDWNRDGDFQDPGEQVVTGQAVSTGTVNLSIPVPLTATPGASYARFRLCATNDCATPGQTSSTGEVEDYPVTIRSASVTIIKDAVPNAAQEFSFSSSSAAFGSAFTLDDDAASPLPDRRTVTLPPGNFTVSETDLPGWTLTGLTCTDPDGGSTTSLQNLTATLDLDGGENVVCTFTNTRDNPAVAVVKTATTNWGADSQPQVGESITFNYRVSNTGNVAVFDIGVAEQQASFTGTGTLPTPSYVSGGSDLDGQADAIDLAPGASAIFSASYTITQADIDRGSIANQVRANATSPDGVAVSDLSDPASVTGNAPTLTDVVRAPSLQLSKTASVTSFSNSGQPIGYTFTLTNSGNTTLTGVTLDDPLPGLSAPSCVNASNAAVTLPATMAPGAVLTCTASYTTTAADLTAGQVRNTATADSAETAPVSASATVPARYADLRVTKTASNSTYIAGRPLTYTVVVANLGNIAAADVALADAIPAGFTVTSVTSTAGPCNAAATSCSLGSIAAGSSATVTISGTTDPGSTSLTNTASASTTTPDPFPANDTASVTTTGAASADLEVVKTGPASVVSGSTITYTIAVANRGPSNAAAVVLTDTPAAGLTIVSMTASSGASCTIPTCQLGTVVAGGTDTITVVATVAPDASATISNSAQISSTTPDPVAANNESTATATLRQVSDLSIVKVVTSPSVPGEDRQWTMTVTNIGPSTAANTVVVDHLPVGVRYVSDSAGFCTGNGATPQDVTCQLGSLAPGQTVTFTVTGSVAADVTGSLTNVAEVSSDSEDPSLANNQDQASDTASPDADLRMTKSGPDQATPGTSVSWTLSVSNTGPSNATGVTITDTAPAGVTFTAVDAPAGITCTLAVVCTVGSMAVGSSVTITVTGSIDPSATGSLTNTASVSSDTSDTDTADNSDFVETTLVPSADLSLTKLSDADAFVPGEPLTYQLHVRNNGPSSAVAVVSTDPLPDSVSFVSASTPVGSCSHDGSATGGQVACDFGVIEPGTTIDFEIVVNVNPDASGDMTNTAMVSSDTPDPSTANNSGTETFAADPAADLVLDKRGPVTAVAGTEATYAVTVTNAGPSSATNVRVADVIPPEFTITDLQITTGTAECAGNACTTPLLRSGESLVIQVTGIIDASATGTMSNAAEVTSDTPDPNPDNNRDSITTTLDSTADVSLTKSAAGTQIAAGEVGQYDIIATNNGPSTATEVVVSDQMPANATLISATSEGATCQSTATDFACSVAALGPGESVTVVVTARVSASAPESTITNDARVTSSTPDSDSSNNSAQASVNVFRAADLSLAKTASSDQVVPGSQFSYTLTATNNGPSDAEAVRVSDTLPAGLSLVPTPESADCAADGQVVTCSTAGLASGASYTVVLTVAVSPAVADGATLTNGASVSSAISDPNPDNDSASVAVTAASSADLVLTKTPDAGSYTPGLNATFTIAVANTGPSDAPEVVVTDTLPAGVSFVSSSSDCAAAGQVLTCPLGTIAAGESASFEVTVATTADQVDPIVNQASVSSAVPDADTSNNTDTATLTASGLVDLAVTKVADGDILVAGNQMSYTVTVTNNGPSVARSVELTDAAAAGSTIISATPVVAGAMTCTVTAAAANCAAESVAVGETVTVLVVLELRDDYADDSFTNTARVTSATAESVAANNEANATLPVQRHADLALAKTVNPAVGTAGGQATWTLTARNTGPSLATSVVITDTFPEGFTPTDFTTEGPAASCQLTGQELRCESQTIDTTEVLVVTIAGTLSSELDDGSTLSNTAAITAATTDDDATNNSATAVLPINTSADLVVTKTAQDGDVVPGENRTWTIQVANPGPSTARDVVIADDLSAGLTFVSATGATCTAAGQRVTCELGDLPVSNEPVVIELTAAVDPSVTDPVTNQATGSSTTDDPNTANNTGTSSDNVTASADVAITKTIAQTAVSAGEAMTYQLVVTNDGSSTATAVSVSDALPDAVTFVSVSDARCAAVDQTLSCDLGALLPGAIVAIDVQVVTDPDASAAISNTATVASATTDTDGSNNSSTVTITPDASADLSITKTASASSVNAGDPVSYDIVVSNAGPSTATAVVITDTLPDGVSLTALPANCTQAGQVITCQVGTVAPGASVTLSLATVVSADAGAGALTNTGEVASSTADANPANNVAAAVVQVDRVADLGVTKTANQESVVPGGTASYTLVVSNAGPSTAVDAVVVDALPAGMSFVSDAGGLCGAAEGGFSCALGTVAVGDSITVVVTVAVASSVPDGVSLVNSATVSSTTPDSVAENNSSSATVTTLASADLSLTKTGPESFVPGEQVSFTLAVTNAGPSDAPQTVVSDTLPAGLSFVSSTGGCVAQGQEVTCEVGTLASGAQTSIELVVATDPGVQTAVVNTATVSSAVADADPANNSSSVTVAPTAQADLAVVKVADAASVAAGTELGYTVLASNSGSSVAREVLISDVAPPGTTIVSAVVAAGDANCTVAAGQVECAAATLAPGATIEVRLVLAVDAGLTAAEVANTATIASTTTDPVAENNSSTATVQVSRSADLSVTKQASAPVMVAGATASWTMTLRNAGPATATTVSLTDSLPAGFVGSQVTSSDAGVSCQLSGSELSCAAEQLAVGAQVTVTVTGAVAADVADQTVLSNTASITAVEADADLTNNSATATATVATSADLVITKTAEAGDVVPGQNRTWTIQVLNPGPSVAREVVVTDVLSDGLTFVSSTGASCAAAGQTVSCDLGDLPVSAEPVVLTVTAAVDPSLTEPVSNSATVTSSTVDPDEGNNTGTASDAVAPNADLAVTKTVAQTAVAAGAEMTYQLVITNDGASTAADVVLSDALPETVSFVSVSDDRCVEAGGTLSCALGSVLPGGIVAIDVAVVIDADVSSEISNTATVSSATADANTANNSSTVAITPDTSADLSITKTASSATVVAGEAVSFDLVVRNDGPSDATAVQVIDTLPTGLTVTSLPDTCTQEAQVITCGLGTIAADASVTVTISTLVAADAPAGSIINSAAVSSSTPDEDDTNNVANATVQVERSADLSVTKTANQVTVTPGETASYTLTVSNAGPSTAVNAVLVDTLPVGMSFVSDGGGLCVAAEGGFSCAIGTLAVDQSITVVATVQVASSVADQSNLTNSVTVSSDTPDPSAENNTASAAVTVAASADLSITKTAPESYVPGTQTTFTLTVSNAGASDAPEVVVTDALPAGLSFVSSTGDCTAAGQTITCAVGALAAGAQSSLELVVATDPGLNTAVVNTATVASAVADPTAANNSSTATLAPQPQANLSVAKVADRTSVAAGTQVSYILSALNSGPSVARSVVLSDTAPQGSTIVSAVVANGGASCSVTANTVECGVDELGVGASFDVQLTVALDPSYTGSQLVNTATVTSQTPDPIPGNNTSTSTIDATRSADVWVTKAANATTMTAGASAGWTITLGNDGPATATSVSLSDVLPAGFVASSVSSSDPGLSCQLNGAELGCSAEQLAVGATITVTVNGTVAADLAEGAVLSNTATIAAAEADADSSDNSATATATVDTSADLAITKTAQGGEVIPGQNRTWTIQVANAGPSLAGEVVVTDVLSEGLTFVSDSAGRCRAVGQTVTCDLGDVAVGAPVVLELTAAVDASVTGPIENTAQVSSSTTDPAAQNNSATASDQVSPQADLVMSKTVAQQEVVEGQPLSYQLAVSNVGSSSATAVVITDELPSQVSFVAVSDDRCQVAAGVVSCAVGTLLPGQIVTINVEVVVNEIGEISNTATVTSPTADANPDNNTSTVTVSPSTVSDLAVSVTPDVASAAPGEQITWTVNLSNAGPSDARAVVVTISIPAGQSITSVPDGCTVDGQTVTCTFADLASGAQQPLQIVTTVTSDTGRLTLSATVAAEATDPVTSNNSATAEVGRADPPIVQITKTATGPAVLGADGQVRASFGFTVSNVGDRPSPFVVTDELLFGAGVTLVSATPTAVDAPAELVAEPTSGDAETVTVASGQIPADGSYRFVLEVVVDVSGVTDPAAVDCTLAAGEQGTGLLDRATATAGGPAALECLPLPLEPQLTVTKVAHQQQVEPGAEVNFSITVTSTGSGPAADVSLTDPMPAGLTAVRVESPYDCVVADAQVSCQLGDLPKGDSRTIVVVATLDEAANSPVRNVATATMINAATAGSASASAAATVVMAPDGPTTPPPSTAGPTAEPPSIPPSVEPTPLPPTPTPTPSPRPRIPLPTTGAAGMALWLLIVTAAGGGLVGLGMGRSRRR